MQDPTSAYYQAMMKPSQQQQQQQQQQFPEQNQLKCPRCDSTNTKFCYYNNYNLSQPRHFCKSCRRYWTKGGALRNIPVGGGSRKNTKRSAPKRVKNPEPDRNAAHESSSTGLNPSLRDPRFMGQGQVPTRDFGLLGDDQDIKALDIGVGSFSSLLASNGQLGSILGGLNGNGSGPKNANAGDFGQDYESGHRSNADLGQNPGVIIGRGGGDEGYCWSECGNGWSDLTINATTPGSSFQ